MKGSHDYRLQMWREYSMVVWIEVYLSLSTVITLYYSSIAKLSPLLWYLHFREFIHWYCDRTSSLVVLNLVSTLSRHSPASTKLGFYPAFRSPSVAWQVPVESHLFLGPSYLSQQIEILLHHCFRMFACASKNIYISLIYPTHDPRRGLTTQLSPPEIPVSCYLRRGVRSESLPPTVSSVST